MMPWDLSFEATASSWGTDLGELIPGELRNGQLYLEVSTWNWVALPFPSLLQLVEQHTLFLGLPGGGGREILGI